MNAFRESVLNLCQPNRTPPHAPLERSPQQSQQQNDNISFNNGSSAAQAASKKQILDNLNKLMTSCVILRIEDFTLFRVTTSGKKQMPKELISGKLQFSEFIDFQFHFRITFSLFFSPFQIKK